MNVYWSSLFKREYVTLSLAAGAAPLFCSILRKGIGVSCLISVHLAAVKTKIIRLSS